MNGCGLFQEALLDRSDESPRRARPSPSRRTHPSSDRKCTSKKTSSLIDKGDVFQALTKDRLGNRIYKTVEQFRTAMDPILREWRGEANDSLKN